MESLVELRSLAVSLGGTPVLRDLTLTLEAGELAIVVGPNGSGKTTLLRVMAALLRPNAGTVHLLGADKPAGWRSRRARIGYVGHVPLAYPDLTLEENLELVAALGGHDRTRIGRILDVVGLGAASDLAVSAMSAGMQRRLDLARLIMTAPDLLLLDEPTAGLDRDARGLIAEVVATARARGAGAVVVSHERGVVDAPTHEYVLRNGALEAS